MKALSLWYFSDKLDVEEREILQKVLYHSKRDEKSIDEAFHKVLLIHWCKIQQVLLKESEAKAYKTRSCLNALVNIVQLRYSLNEEFPMTFGHPFLEGVLLKIETLCQAIKKRVFQSISKDQTFFDAYELDEMFLDVSSLIRIGEFVPWIDLQCVTPFGYFSS